MKHNVGSIDRGLRIVVGLAALGAGYYFHSWWGAVGLIPLVTGAAGSCPAYGIFKISTSR